MSHQAYPKQYLPLHGDTTLVQQTALRLQSLTNAMAPILITNQDQRFLLAEQLRSVGIRPNAIILESIGRNTAPAAAVASLLAERIDPEAKILVLPSDHVILHPEVFAECVARASLLAEKKYLVTFGIEPTLPHTGYGYIRRGTALKDAEKSFTVDAFVEKPTTELAAEFLTDGSYYWNSGMFLFKASVYLSELARLEPEILRCVQEAVDKGEHDLDFLRLQAEAFSVCPAKSIDYAIMEHTSYAAVVEAAGMGWNDIGSWTSLADLEPKDNNNNSLIGNVLVENVHNTYIRAEHRMVAALGIEDIIVIETADVLLVAHKNAAQDVKKIVDRLNASGNSESITHQKVFRPWGSYEDIDQGERFQVKRIVVNPGASLSLQMHYHRAEHWIVVKGTAKVINGGEETLLSENQSTYIPLGMAHRLENPGKIPLELIEVQSGAYLGEDDIVRFNDVYGRN